MDLRKILCVMAVSTVTAIIGLSADVSSFVHAKDAQFFDLDEILKREYTLYLKKDYAGIDIYEIKRKEKTVAYAITEEDKMNDSKYIKILKFSVIGNQKIKEAALAAFLKFTRKQDYSLIRVWDDEEIYIKLGFVEMKRHVNPFIVNVLNEQKLYLENEKLWNVGFLDLD